MWKGESEKTPLSLVVDLEASSPFSWIFNVSL